ncbi:MAG: metal-dependent transcriptional regulator [Thermoanaerobaculia bacterium]|nr:metal-dependent transcriptional regulator [Thermoanaerobaculia bacterium]MCZ7650589.1 metal-dependent transcriptional regulator [Thermoanaerobaculia bacterium]
MPTISAEDYLKHILKLQEGEERVSTSALATSLSLADASVTEMLKKLAARGLVRYQPYQGVTLTEKGRGIAVRTLRRHRLWELFLVRHLGYSWDQIHEEAERLEHVTSEALETALDRALGSPQFDPHGDPIPSAEGRVHGGASSALAALRPGAVAKIRRVADVDPELLRHADRLGIVPEASLEVRERLDFDGSLRVRVAGGDRFLSAEVARHIFVELVEERSG